MGEDNSCCSRHFVKDKTVTGSRYASFEGGLISIVRSAHFYGVGVRTLSMHRHGYGSSSNEGGSLYRICGYGNHDKKQCPKR